MLVVVVVPDFPNNGLCSTDSLYYTELLGKRVSRLEGKGNGGRYTPLVRVIVSICIRPDQGAFPSLACLGKLAPYL